MLQGFENAFRQNMIVQFYHKGHKGFHKAHYVNRLRRKGTKLCVLSEWLYLFVSFVPSVKKTLW